MEAFLDTSGTQLVDLMRGDGGIQEHQEIRIPLHQMEAVVSLFYSAIEDVYVGVDSHLPSRFLQVHPFLLGSLAEGHDGGDEDGRGHPECHAPRSVRIIPLSRKQLEDDFEANTDLAQRYFEEHDRRRIKLLAVEPRKHEQIFEAILAGEWTGDLGVWANTCALLFEGNINPHSKQLRLELIYPREERFAKCVRYVSRLIEQAKLVTLNNDQIVMSPVPPELKEHLLWSLDSMFQPSLADVWDEFVAPTKRVDKLGPFVDARIDELGLSKASILDAATGVGCDSAYLLSKGHEVVSNEIDHRLIAHAKELTENGNGHLLQLTRFDWRHFEHLADSESFDVVLALGNSMSCLRTADDVKMVLRRFAYLLRPDGLLIVDERNYPAMFDERRAMGKPDFRFPGRVVYCSQTIQARPKVIPAEPGVDRDVLTLEYIRSRTGKAVGTFQVLPFAQDQLKGLLEESGFRSVRTFYNFSETGKHERAQFITYVASRTYDDSELTSGEEVEAVFAFTDVSGSTELKKHLGEQAYAKEWAAHEKRMQSLLRKHKGRKVNDTGDGFLLAFDHVPAALACLREFVRDPGTSKLQARAGLTKGVARQDRHGNLRGRDVDVAARICDRARPNLIVADDRVKLLAPDVTWSKLDRIELKGAGSWYLFVLSD